MALRERYRALRQSSTQLDRVFSIALNAGAERVYLDRPYTDFDFRSDLSHFYGRAFRPPPETTERLIFATAESVMGASVIRPLPQQVGRTLMPPPADLAPYVSCQAIGDVHAFGGSWQVSGFPFTSQDGEYGVCAHAALWAIARYHNLRFGADRYTTSAIIDAAGLRERPDRTARSDGLYGFDIVRAFRGIGLPALQYDVDSIPSTSKQTETPDSVIRRYLNSGIPVGVLTTDHMIILVGYGEAASGDVFYVVSDDNNSPYEKRTLIPAGSTGAWKLLLVPLPGRIHVNGEAAEARASECFEDRTRADQGPSHLIGPFLTDQLRIATYAAPSSEYVGRLYARGVPDPIRQHHYYAPKGNWVWVSEFQDPAAPADARVVGEIVIDATSMQLDPAPVFGNVDGWAYLWNAHDPEPSVTQACASGARYRSALPDRTERAAPTTKTFAPLSGDLVE